MPSQKILTEAANKVFCQRIAFISFQVAGEVSVEDPETEHHFERATYSDMIFRGQEKALLMALHVVALSPEICAALEEGTHDAVSDETLKQAIVDVWNPRSLAFAAVNNEVQKVQQFAKDAAQVAQDLSNAKQHLIALADPNAGVATE